MNALSSWENPIDKAVWQPIQVCKHLGSRPITLWDIEYGCAPFVIKTADIHADKLMRLRSNLCLWGEPPKYSGRGKPRVHGDKFKPPTLPEVTSGRLVAATLNDASTWAQPTQTIELLMQSLAESGLACGEKSIFAKRRTTRCQSYWLRGYEKITLHEF